MFSGLRSRLMLSFSALLLVCLTILTITFVLLFFVWVNLPQFAYSRLLDAAGPLAAHLRVLAQQGDRMPDLVLSIRDLARDRGMRIFLINLPGGRIIADSEDEWVGENVRFVLRSSKEEGGDLLPEARGQVRAPDGGRLFYVAIPMARGEQARGPYLALTMTRWEAARPFWGSLMVSVLLSGLVAFALSILLALWLARSLARPLQRAAQAAERVAAGDEDVLLDIPSPDEARRLASSFNTMIRAVRASQQSQRDFVANVSHELRTPLTSIQGFAQAILDGTAGDAASVQRAASVIHQEADRLARMARDLLDLARLESGQETMALAPLDLTALLRACVSRFTLLAEDKGVQLNLDLPPALQISGDGDRLMQVFTNLIDNALKYTDAGGKIVLRAAKIEDADAVSVLISDTGCGIPQSELPRIFERFYQVDRSRAAKRGVGLGLAIVSEIVRAHGGTIEVQSIEGVGTQFTVTLPVPSAQPQT